MSATPLGPGTLLVGSAGSEVDMSCQIVHAQIEWSKEKDDDLTVLCGDTIPGAVTYTAALVGNVFQDSGDAAGIVRSSWDPAKLMGKTVPFEFVPNTADGVAATGDLTVDPVTFGMDDAGAKMASDFTWDIVGHPILVSPIPA